MSLGYYVPRCFWVFAENNVFSEIVQDLQARLLDRDKKEEQLKKLATFLKHKKGEHKTLFLWHIISQLLYISNILGQFFHLNLLFSGDFLLYGYKKNMNEVFPKKTSCDLSHYGYSGHEELNSLTCYLPLNTLYDKLFLVIWYMMSVSGILLVINLLYTVMYITFPPFRYFILKQKVGKKVHKNEILRVITGLDFFSEVSECFFIEMISQNLSNDTVSELFHMI